MKRIDAHAHIMADHPESLAFLAERDLACVNICGVWTPDLDWRDGQRRHYRRQARLAPDRHAWITTFDLPRFDEPDWADRVIEELDKDFADGAIACKVWKNIGMELKTPDGAFMQVDHPLLEPVFRHIARADRTLLMHIGEPLACWRPLDPSSPHYGYYSRNPEWHMHGKAGFPSHEEIMGAWERMIARHPDLRIVGAHLGSQEYDVAAVAARMDRYPNYAVDISARWRDMAVQDPAKVRGFFASHGDRILFGIDAASQTPHTELSDEERGRSLADYDAEVARCCAYFGTSDEQEVAGRTIRGLALPERQLEAFYLGNARRWYPGMAC